jgi:hypothetical protein
MKEGNVTKAQQLFFGAIEVINFVLATESLVSDFALADKMKRASLVINYYGGLTDAAVAIGVILKLADKPVKYVGMIASALDVVGAILEGINAYNGADNSSLVGQGIVGVGSALIGAGCYAVVFGGSTAITGVGIPVAAALELVGAILVAAGTVIAVFTKDSDIELFTSHCRWGRAHNNGQITLPAAGPFAATPPSKPDWASAIFSEWSKGEAGLDHQIASLISLMASFVAEAQGFTTVRIYPGVLNRTSKMFIKFDIEYFGENVATPFHPQLWLDFDAETMSLAAGSDPADLSKVSFGDLNGRAFVELRAEPAVHLGIKQAQVTRSDCKMMLDLDGDGKVLIPISKKLVPYHVSDLGRGINPDHVKSTDF